MLGRLIHHYRLSFKSAKVLKVVPCTVYLKLIFCNADLCPYIWRGVGNLMVILTRAFPPSVSVLLPDRRRQDPRPHRPGPHQVATR